MREKYRDIRADLHNHFSTRSLVLDFDRVVERISRTLGPGGICGFVNFEDQRYEAFSKHASGDRIENLGNALYVLDKDLLIVKGQEVPTQQGHLLVLGLEEGTHLKSGEDLEETIGEAEINNGVIIADHPFYYQGVGEFLTTQGHDIFQRLDGFEVHNGEAAFSLPFGPLPRDANELARIAYDKFRWGSGAKVGAISSSDGHSFKEVGSSYTMLKMPSYAGFATSEDVSHYLREAVRGAVDIYKKNSKWSAFKHALALAGIIALSKTGLKKQFGDKEALR